MKFHGFHQLPDLGISQDHDGISIQVGKVEGVVHKVGHFLNGSGRKHDAMIVAMPAPLDSLKIVRL